MWNCRIGVCLTSICLLNASKWVLVQASFALWDFWKLGNKAFFYLVPTAPCGKHRPKSVFMPWWLSPWVTNVRVFTCCWRMNSESILSRNLVSATPLGTDFWVFYAKMAPKSLKTTVAVYKSGMHSKDLDERQTLGHRSIRYAVLIKSYEGSKSRKRIGSKKNARRN